MSFGASKGEDGFALIYSGKVPYEVDDEEVKIENIRNADILSRHQRVISTLRSKFERECERFYKGLKRPTSISKNAPHFTP